MAADERFSTSICTVTRVPGGTRTSESDRWIGDPLLSPPDEERRDRRQRGQAEGDDLEAGGADDPCGQPHRESGEQDGHPAAGRHQGFSATGTGTSARISSRMTCGDRPLMTASAVTMIRWASTGMASAFTSSGIT